MESNLTSGRLLARNTVWNVAGLVLPLAVGVVAIPPLVAGLGVDRFGLLSLGWVIIGYFSLFDLGIGRALTKLVADRLASREQTSIPPLVWTSLILMLVLGVAGTLVGLVISPWLVGSGLNVPAGLYTDALHSFWILAVSIPVVTVSSGLRGVLEAHQKFRVINLIRTPMGLFSFIGPLCVLPFSDRLVPVTIVLVAGRAAGAVAYWLACLRSMPGLRRRAVLDRTAVAPLVRFGGWMTVTNVVGPLMVYLDRFLVGAVLSVGAIAYYVAPFEVVARILVIPGALASVLFPAFAVSIRHDAERASLLLRRGLKYVFVGVFPAVLIIAVFAPEGLAMWLGPDFAQRSSPVLRWLAAAIFVNGLAQIPFALIQGAGRPDLTAKLHLIELPFYLGALWYLTRWMGIEGTAIAWMVRSTADAACIAVFAGRLLPLKSAFLLQAAAAVIVGLLLLWVGVLVEGMALKVTYSMLVLSVLGLMTWFVLLDGDERLLLRRASPPQVHA